MAKKFNFEEGIARLEEIVNLLSHGDAPLDKSLELFEEGTNLIKKCSTALDNAEQKVTMLLKDSGAGDEVPFAEDEI